MTRIITHIVIHCADTPDGRSVMPADVDSWHKQRGFKRSDAWRKRFNPRLYAIGYHYLIDVDGQIYTGRHEDEVGAHAKGHNSASLGICLAGRGRYTIAQWRSLELLVNRLRHKHGASVCGHRDLPGVAKDCPCFSVGDWMGNSKVPFEEHILREEKP